MGHPAKGRQRRLQFADLRPHDEGAVIEHGGDAPVDLVADPVALRGEVDEGDGLHASSLWKFARIAAKRLSERYRNAAAAPFKIRVNGS